jgi:hypothetical protein
VIGFIDYFEIVTTINYSTIALSTLYKSLHHTLSLLNLLSLVASPVMNLNTGDSSASVFTSLLSGEYSTTELIDSTNSQAGGHLTPTS